MKYLPSISQPSVCTLHLLDTHICRGRKMIPPPMQMFIVKNFCSNMLFHRFSHCIIGSALVPFSCCWKAPDYAHKALLTGHTRHLFLWFPTAKPSWPQHQVSTSSITQTEPYHFPRTSNSLQLLAVLLAGQDHSSIPSGAIAFPGSCTRML